MARLPYFVPPLTGSLLTRTQVAHTSRGFCWLLRGERGVNRSILDLSMVLGVWDKMPPYVPPEKREAMMPATSRRLLQLISNFWQRDMEDIDIRWISLFFRQMPSEQQDLAADLALRFLTTGQYLTSRHERAQLMKTSDTIPQDIMARLEQSLGHLEQALLVKDPMMPQHLRNTHSLLISYPETVHLLDDAEVSRLIDAAEIHTKTEIVKAVAAGKSSGGSRKKVDIGDL